MPPVTPSQARPGRRRQPTEAGRARTARARAAAAGAWTGMTPEQRRAEVARRMAGERRPRAEPEPPDISAPGRRRYRTVLSPEERSEKSRAAQHSRWSRVTDTAAETAPARDAARARFYAEADRQGITDPATRDRMARHAELAHLSKMRLAKLKAERLRAAAAQAAEAGEREAG